MKMQNIIARLMPEQIALLSKSRNWKRLMLDEQGQLKPEARAILADLAQFCRANSTSFTPGDPHTSTHLEGRREVFTRIVGYIGLNELAIYKLEEEEMMND